MWTPSHRQICLSLVVGLVCVFSPEPSHSAEEQLDILELDLGQLMQTEVIVTSVSKRPQKLHEAASGIFVVTQEDIRRMGAVNIMEALRIVPGLQVARVDQTQYTISARGFLTSQFGSNKLLVLMDGRTIYNPLFAGVIWAAQDTMMEDIDRIEVIRGPGAALWGSNAVAGVINIITKHSSKTQGTLLSGGGGTEEKGFGSVRHGGKIGESFFYRAYAKYRDQDSGKDAFGNDAFDAKEMVQGGFRSDWQVNSRDHLTLQGDYYDVEFEDDTRSRFVSFTPPFTSPFKTLGTFSGGNLLARWNRALDNDSNIKLQAYYDRINVEDFFIVNTGTIDQWDLEFQHDFRWGESQLVSWGLNYRFANFNAPPTIAANIPNEDTHLYSFFVHDEITLVPKTWSLILGSKFEQNQFSGFEVQPNIRTVWTPDPEHTLWAAVSRAVRIPFVLEDGGQLNVSGQVVLVPVPNPFPPPPFVLVPTNVILRQVGDPDFEAEEVLAFEVGYRQQISPKLSFDVTGFLNLYDNLGDNLFGALIPEATPPPDAVQFIFRGNALEGEVAGVELTAEWKPFDRWRLAGSYSYIKIDLRAKEGVVVLDPVGGNLKTEDEPNHHFNVRSYLNLPHNFELDLLLYYQSRYVARNVDEYVRLDVRLGWKPIPEVELSLIGQNLLDSQHPEFGDQFAFRTETERSVYAKATLHF